MSKKKSQSNLPITPPSSSLIPTLRVAQSELVSGDTGGKVFMRLSEGGVAFLTDRSKAQEQVSSQLRQAILADDSNAI